MTREDALAFLRQHQPMPPDGQLSEELITEYDEVRKYFVDHPDTDAIPLLLNSFGEGSGFGVYQLVEEAFEHFPPEVVIPHLAKALESDHTSVRAWSAQVATGFPTPKLIPALSNLLNGDDEDERSSAAIALKFIDDPRVDAVFRNVLKSSDDPNLCEYITEALIYRAEKKE